MGGGFSVQMVFIFIDTDHKEGSGFTQGPAGHERHVRARGRLGQVHHPVAAVDLGRVRIRGRGQGRPTMKAAVIVPTRTQGLAPHDSAPACA